ncbi:hypothetical protein PAMP_015358 [Pampus punctatissimus]
MGDESYPENRAQKLFDEFVSASTCRATLRSFSQLCEHLQLDPSVAERPLYQPIKHRLNYWRANALWAKLDRRAAQQEYLRARACTNTTCVIVGAGPCGLRAAVELGFLGARVVLVEKRDSFSRNNVLHLWPFTIHDLRGLGAKKFYGKFCASSIDHISIRQLQLILLKVALLLGVEVHVNVEFKNLVEPPEDQHRHSFRRKEFRGKLAIAITANFKNRNTTAEAKVEEISGVAFIFNQTFFQELRQETGIDLENIVYYKDDTHYFVMTAKKQSLLEKGVILQDFADIELLLSRSNVNQNALQAYAREAANFSTNHQLPSLDFAMNHYGQPDVAMFDFTCMYASENAAMVRQRHGHHLLLTLVGDSLLEPFWPMGTGVARGFLAALDSSWMIRRWSQGDAPLDILAESAFDSLDKAAVEENTRLGFEVSEREFGISPLLTVEEMLSVEEPDSLSMVMYLSQFYQLLKDMDTTPPAGCLLQSADIRVALITPASLLSRLGHNPSCKRNPEEHRDTLGKRRKTSRPCRDKQESCDLNGDDVTQVFEEGFEGGSSGSRVRLIANQLQAKLGESLSSCRSFSPAAALHRQSHLVFPVGGSDVCFFCKQRVYVMERLSAEGLFFHRSCFQCDLCSNTLKLAAYAYHAPSGTFYCLQHYDSRQSTPAARRRPTPSDRAASHRTSVAGKALVAMPERIELENYHQDSKVEMELLEEAEEVEEISEEALNRFNLNVEDKHTNRSSSESEMEEESSAGGRHCMTLKTARASWRQTLQVQLHLRDEEEDHEDEDEGGSEVESSDEGEYDPWEMERHTGLWLLLEEETEEDFSHPLISSAEGGVITPDSTSSDTHSFDDINPELLPKKPLFLHKGPDEEGVGSDEEGLVPEKEERRRRCSRGAHTLPPRLPLPLQGGSGSLLLHLRGLREALPLSQIEVEGGGARALWRAVFSGNRKKKRKGGASLPGAEKLKKETANPKRSTDLRRGLYLTEKSDLDSSTLLQRCALAPRNNPAYVPHALAFKRAYAIKRRSLTVKIQDSDGLSSCPTEVVGVLVQPKEASSLSVKETMFHRGQEPEDEDLDAKITRRVQRAAQRQAKQEELKRLHKAQVSLPEGRDRPNFWGDSGDSTEIDLHLGAGLGKLENPGLMQQWFQLVQQKNALVRYESELIIFTQELQLEDRQSRLQQELRERMAVDDHLKDEAELLAERLILEEMLEVVEQRDALVSQMEEQRLQERQENQDLEAVMMSRELGLHWT